MSKLRLILASVTLVLSVAAGTASATSFGNIVIFGDSLTDTDNIYSFIPLPALPYAPGRVSNGPVWVETLAANLGLSVTGAYSPSGYTGGNNYAFAGALTGVDGTIPFVGAPIPSLLSQRDTYLANNSVDPNTLYVIWGGGNNVRTDTVADTATDITSIITSLAAQGATNFLVPNLPNIGLTPESIAGQAPACAGLTAVECQDFMSDVTMFHNDSLAAALGALDPSLNVMLFDVFSIFNNLVTDPGMFGFTNTSEQCWDGDNFGNGVECSNPDEYIFYDGIHPTAAAHALLGEMATAQVVPVPAAVWLFGSALFGLIGLRRRSR